MNHPSFLFVLFFNTHFITVPLPIPFTKLTNSYFLRKWRTKRFIRVLRWYTWKTKLAKQSFCVFPYVIYSQTLSYLTILKTFRIAVICPRVDNATRTDDTAKQTMDCYTWKPNLLTQKTPNSTTKNRPILFTLLKNTHSI